MANPGEPRYEKQLVMHICSILSFDRWIREGHPGHTKNQATRTPYCFPATKPLRHQLSVSVCSIDQFAMKWAAPLQAAWPPCPGSRSGNGDDSGPAIHEPRSSVRPRISRAYERVTVLTAVLGIRVARPYPVPLHENVRIFGIIRVFTILRIP